MSTVLVIKAHPATEDVSNSLVIGDHFVETYRQAHPEDQIIGHDLYAEGVPEINSSNLDSWKKLTNGCYLSGAFRKRADLIKPSTTASRTIHSS